MPDHGLNVRREGIRPNRRQVVMFWLDWKFFGNGRGMASPYWDDVFYWLGGRFYRWIGGLGAQLESYEWRVPLPQIRRCLFGHDFYVFSAERRWLRVRVSWVLVGQVRDAEHMRELHAELVKWRHGK